MLHKTLKFIIFLFLFSVLGITVYYFDLISYADAETLRTFLAMFGFWAPVAMVFVYAAATVAFLPATAFSLASGFLFGPYVGFFVILCGATLGAAISFVVSRWFGEDFVAAVLKKHSKKSVAFDNGTEENGFWLVLFSRCIPVVPYNVMNLLLGLTNVRFGDYVLATIVGIAPFSFVYAQLGSSIADVDVWDIILAIVLLSVLLIVVSLLRKSLHKHKKNEYDMIIIGAGAAGLNIAGFMNRAGFKTLLIEKQDKNIGGDCLNYGCIPSKALIHAAHVVHDARMGNAFGLKVSGTVSLKKVREYVHGKIEQIRKYENADYLRKKGMEIALGAARFVSKNKISVGRRVYTAKKIVLATGSRPRVIDIPGIEHTTVYTNETLFDLDALPKKLIVIGGGPIGCEMAQAFNRLGAQVTLIQRGTHLLDKEDPEASQYVMKQLEQEGVDIHVLSEVVEFKKGSKAIVKTADGGRTEHACDAVFVAVGRVFDFSELSLEKAGIQVDEKGKLTVDDYLRTTNKNIFAAGDVAGGLMFTHMTELHAATIIRNLFSPLKKKLNTDSFSWVTYTAPELATFGLSENTIKDRNIKYEVLSEEINDVDRAITDDYPLGFVKLFVSKKGKLLGGTLVAPHAGEIMQELVLAQSQGLGVESIFNKVYAYPVASRMNKKTISPFFARKLTKRSKQILRLLFR